jgi:hypothetical protein
VAAQDPELTRVDALAQQLLGHLERSQADIDASHVHGAPSKDIQAIVSRLLREELRFGEEVVITPDDGLVTGARPDFFYRLSERRGVLAEVERGGTVNNNHDLKDLWKAHVSPDAQHLFLVVPLANWKSDGSAREKPFVRVRHRIGAFFGEPRREIDVCSAHVFGYGRAE